MPYTVNKQPQCVAGTVKSVETFSETYQYYTLNLNIQDSQVSSPILNQDGAVPAGIVQPSADGQNGVAYAVSARFANDLGASGMAVNDPVLDQTSSCCIAQ